ncbi:MAG: ABC transporter ATP-binding protein, partial [Dehalococcoidales bacterium]|nr:ABC transporter ATP-binding protein [Dehalococcoidales bacterium]
MIKLENVTKVYRDGTRAVDNVSLEVNEGEICVFLGPSGCGKTTTMKMINRLIPLTSGTIFVNGQDNKKIKASNLRRDIGYAIQEIGLFVHMTVGQNIETVPVLKGWSKEKRRQRVEELLRLIRMDPGEYINKYPAELSGGQRQRIGVARALGADPPILLMDEPFGAIDPINRVELQTEFLKIQEEIKKTIIFVTHDIYEAIKMGDRIALMKDGKLVQYDTPANILYRPKNEFVEGFVGADRALKGLQLLRVKDVMNRDIPTVTLEDNMDTVRQRLSETAGDSLAVVNEQQQFLGWINAAALENRRTVRDAMEESSVSTGDSAVLSEALSVMLASRFRSLPIVDTHGQSPWHFTGQAKLDLNPVSLATLHT